MRDVWHIIRETWWSFRHPGQWYREATRTERVLFIGGVVAMVLIFLATFN